MILGGAACTAGCRWSVFEKSFLPTAHPFSASWTTDVQDDKEEGSGGGFSEKFEYFSSRINYSMLSPPSPFITHLRSHAAEHKQ